MSEEEKPCHCLKCRIGDLILAWSDEPPTEREPDRHPGLGVRLAVEGIASLAVISAQPGMHAQAAQFASKAFSDALICALRREGVTVEVIEVSAGAPAGASKH